VKNYFSEKKKIVVAEGLPETKNNPFAFRGCEIRIEGVSSMMRKNYSYKKTIVCLKSIQTSVLSFARQFSCSRILRGGMVVFVKVSN